MKGDRGEEGESERRQQRGWRVGEEAGERLGSRRVD